MKHKELKNKERRSLIRLVGLGVLCASAVNSSVLSFASPTAESLPVVGVVLPADPELAEAIRDACEHTLDELAPEAAEPPLRLVYAQARTGAWSAAGQGAVDLVVRQGAVLLVAPPERDAAHLVVQVGGKTRTPVLVLCAAPDLAATGSPWCFSAVVLSEDTTAPAQAAPADPALWAAAAIRRAATALQCAGDAPTGPSLREALTRQEAAETSAR